MASGVLAVLGGVLEELTSIPGLWIDRPDVIAEQALSAARGA